MERYKNLGGNSGVVGYEIAEGSITVQFDDGMKYLYTIRSSGPGAIAEMQRLAWGWPGTEQLYFAVRKKSI
ncbi:hypothetical protein [Pseudomonas aeruginosa]|uniref:hypothetical protein n=2 Tax=Pseudomonas aeruginosa TaxID=287 RepID=UPI001D0B0691|nr:hypothetical protein [Pseudomonas aeruginosa]MCC0190027.1 hypothetical protein [Pseudomonas aeruginosa]